MGGGGLGEDEKGETITIIYKIFSMKKNILREGRPAPNIVNTVYGNVE